MREGTCNIRTVMICGIECTVTRFKRRKKSIIIRPNSISMHWQVGSLLKWIHTPYLSASDWAEVDEYINLKECEGVERDLLEATVSPAGHGGVRL